MVAKKHKKKPLITKNNRLKIRKHVAKHRATLTNRSARVNALSHSFNMSMYRVSKAKASKGQIMVRAPLSTKFRYAKKIHSSVLFRGITVKKVKPNKNMSADRLILRHLATSLLTEVPEAVEVQCAIFSRLNERREIYVSSNSKQNDVMNELCVGTNEYRLLKDLPTDLLNLSGLKKGTREYRHRKKLATEIKSTSYANCEILMHKSRGDVHAETRLVNLAITFDHCFDYVAGTRRPCSFCTAFMQYYNVPKSSYNNHPGALWSSKRALNALHSVSSADVLAELQKFNGTYFINDNLAQAYGDDYDTDSE